VTLAPVLEVASAGVAEGIAPAVAAEVARGTIVVHASLHGDAQRVPTARPLRPGDRFDLASVTKPYVASAVARLADRGVLSLDDRAARWLPGFRGDKDAVTIRHLLAHSSGLPAWHPFFARAIDDPLARPAFVADARRAAPELLASAFRRGREIVEEGIAAARLESPPGARAVYSDLGFIALGLVLERVCGVSLDAVVEAEVTRPLALHQTWFVPEIDLPRALARRTTTSFVATRACPARGGEVLCGAVDDDNAWAMGGVAGHAGLFATPEDVAAFGAAWLDTLAGRSDWLSREMASAFAARDKTPGSDRALGWDTPARAGGSSIGTRLGMGPQGAIGHLGFTGTSLWLDRDRELVCVLLTNAVHPGGADKGRMKAFRARFHDAIAKALPV